MEKQQENSENMENVKKELENYEGKTGRPSVRQAILWVLKDNPDSKYTANDMVKILDERYAFRVSKPVTMRMALMRLTRDGILIRKLTKSESGHEAYRYWVRKPEE